MSTSHIHANGPIANPERRRHARQKLSNLAYLDIGADNGGIILNVSDEGMGIQSALPLAGEQKINLRIQLLHSRARLETEAEIIWLGPGSQQAGVRFFGMSSEVRVQFQDWIRGQHSPSPASQGSVPNVMAPSGSPRKLDPVPETRKNKWLSLINELEEQKRLLEIQQSEVVSGETGETDALTHDKLPSHVVLRNLLIYSDGQESHSQDAHLKQYNKIETPEQLDTGLPLPTKESQLVKAESDCLPEARTKVQPDPPEILDWPIRVSRTLPNTILKNTPKAPAHPTNPVDPPVSISEVNSNVEEIRAASIRTALAPTKSGRAAGWVVPAILLTSICILFFGVGTWVGRPVNRTQVTQPLAGSEVNESSTSPGGKDNPVKQPGVYSQKTATGDAAANIVPKPRPRKLTLTLTPPIEISSPQPAPTVASSTVLTATNPSEGSPAPMAAAPTPDPQLLAPRIVAGRKLKPTDRYNPCHLTYRVEPEYPAEARQRRIEGSVRIHQTIGADGSVQSVKLIGGPPLLATAAMEAAKYWRYLPALLNGQPVETEQDIEISFRLPR